MITRQVADYMKTKKMAGLWTVIDKAPANFLVSDPYSGSRTHDTLPPLAAVRSLKRAPFCTFPATLSIYIGVPLFCAHIGLRLVL
jgi:hypothetical protein